MNEYIKLYLSDGTEFLVDIEDIPKIFNQAWHRFSNRGKIYVRGWDRNRRKKVLLHRLIMDVDNKNAQVDHINGNTLDNRKINLRICNSTQNIRNRPKHSNNTSGFKGVYKCESKWKVVIGVDGKRIYLGTFNCKQKAALAYNQAAKKYHKEFACLNNVKGGLSDEKNT